MRADRMRRLGLTVVAVVSLAAAGVSVAASSTPQTPLTTEQLVWKGATIEVQMDVDGEAAVQLIGGLLDAAVEAAQQGAEAAPEVSAPPLPADIITAALPLLDPARNAVKSITRVALLGQRVDPSTDLAALSAHYRGLMTGRGWIVVATMRAEGEHVSILMAPEAKGLFGVVASQNGEVVLAMITTREPIGDLLAQIVGAGGGSALRDILTAALSPQVPAGPPMGVRDDEAWGDRGDLYADAGDDQSAQGCYAVARLLDPEDTEWEEKSSDLGAATQILESFAITDDEFIGDLGDSASQLGDSAAAHSLYQLALSLDPEDEEWQEKVQLEGAAGVELGTAPSDPTDDEAWGDLGDSYNESGDTGSAQGCYAVARLLDPEDEEWQDKCSDLAAAADILKSLNVTDDELIGDLGDSASDLGDTAAARFLYQLALSLDPTDEEWQQKVKETGGEQSSSVRADEARPIRMISAITDKPANGLAS